MKAKNISPFKRWRGTRLRACRICNTGGELIECHTCKVVCHIKCGVNMPNNVQETRVIWRCQECIKEKGPTRCSFATYPIRKQIVKPHIKCTTHINSYNLDTHDTSGMQIIGLIQDISPFMEHTIENVIKKQITSAIPDGYCLFRALGKNHGIHPGEVIKYIKNKCKKMLKTKRNMALESNKNWYRQ